MWERAIQKPGRIVIGHKSCTSLIQAKTHFFPVPFIHWQAWCLKLASTLFAKSVKIGWKKGAQPGNLAPGTWAKKEKGKNWDPCSTWQGEIGSWLSTQFTVWALALQVWWHQFSRLGCLPVKAPEPQKCVGTDWGAGQAAALAAPLDQRRVGSKGCALQAACSGLPHSLLLCALPLPCCLGAGGLIWAGLKTFSVPFRSSLVPHPNKHPYSVQWGKAGLWGGHQTFYWLQQSLWIPLWR